ncbi:aminotransferase class V-fold PLP-dependent enzyme [Candidatus Syntrophocurvum alkaliphilum]|uniref:aminotransferase class V-fold PLP-dependent enzyme n=1 Tax=Candidatus Syntrophocurvum alkaliphilum TaxID=2293317 RepID=UPI001FAAA339|nr:aminotransferase class V-fold PLP-dependent enzyme [Candidatus Syntrophocurvum alkaliphilum]
MFIIGNKFNYKAFRKNIIGIKEKVPTLNGRNVRYINFDNAASTPGLNSVYEQLKDFLAWYSGVHRGTGIKSLIASKAYDDAHEIIGNFVKADLDKNTVIIVKNTTEAINKLSYRLDLKPTDVVITTLMEHHSNDLPWRDKANVVYVGLDNLGRLNLEDLEKKLKSYYPRVKLLAICGASNVTGHINDIHKIAKIAHQYKAEILVDGAQLVPHKPVDIKPNSHPEHIDYIAFSSHKMYVPYGIGVLIGKKETFLKGSPEFSGGGTVSFVTENNVTWANLPDKEEAGSPNVFGTIALAETIKYLQKMNMKEIEQYENELCKYAIKELSKIKNVTVYGSFPRVGVITFNIKGLPHSLVGAVLCYEGGMGVRTGCFCAQPYVRNLLNVDMSKYEGKENTPSALLPGMVRISLAAYNSKSEIDYLLKLVKQIANNRTQYNRDYVFSKKLGSYIPRFRTKGFDINKFYNLM